MTHSNPLHPGPTSPSFPALTRLGGPSSPLGSELARLQGEVRRLEAALRARDHATALVIHELRQPLNVLLLAGAHLAREAKDADPSCIARLRDGVLRLERLIRDLGDKSFLDSGRFTLHVTSTDLVPLLAASIARLGSHAVVSVEGDIPAVDVDPLRVEQIFANLFVNAQKYGASRAAPCVSVARRGGVVVVTVLNDGPSLAEDERIKVFEPYYRGRERSPQASGVGLGLYICKRLVEEHGGRIWTDGDELHTRFSFSLPVLDDVPRVSETRIAVERRSASPRTRIDPARPVAAAVEEGEPCSSNSSEPTVTS